MRSGNDFSDEVVENWGTETQSNFPSFFVYVYFVCKLQWLCVSFLTSLLTVSNYHYDFINILCSVRNYAGIVVKKITCLPKIRSSVFQGVGLLILQFWEIGVKQQQHLAASVIGLLFDQNNRRRYESTSAAGITTDGQRANHINTTWDSILRLFDGCRL